MKIKFSKVIEFLKKSQTEIKDEMSTGRQIRSSAVALRNTEFQLKRESKVLKTKEKNWITQ